MILVNKLREQIADKFIKSLKEDVIPWEKGWFLTESPVNHSGKAYRGINRLWLSVVAEENGYKDNRWMTFNQAVSKGYKIKSGSVGAKIEFWSLYDTVTKNKVTNEDIRKLNLTDEEIEKRFKPISSIYTVFNAEQIEGIPAQKFTNRDTITEKSLDISLKKMLKAMGVELISGGDRACYVPDEDVIKMPVKEQFKSSYSYMATLIHEAAHATGHESRLNRNIRNTFGTPDYAKEELRAEISSAFMSQKIHLSEKGIENHKAYIQSWIRVLENKPDELFAAIKDAEKIADYLLENGQFKCLEYSESKEDYIAKMDKMFLNEEPVSAKERAIYTSVMKERYSDKTLKEIAEETILSMKKSNRKECEREM